MCSLSVCVCVLADQVVASLRLAGFTRAFPLPAHLQDRPLDNAVSALLVRWFAAHPAATLRDDKGRPVCNGPLGVNHCQYVWARTTRIRHCICTDLIWRGAQLHLRPAARQQARTDLAYARFEFQQPSAVEAYVSMNPQREWDPRARRWGPVTSFLETVVIP